MGEDAFAQTHMRGRHSNSSVANLPQMDPWRAPRKDSFDPRPREGGDNLPPLQAATAANGTTEGVVAEDHAGSIGEQLLALGVQAREPGPGIPPPKPADSRRCC